MRAVIEPNILYTAKLVIQPENTCSIHSTTISECIHKKDSPSARDRIDNLIDSIGNYIKKGRCYSERDLCRIYYKVKRNEPTWIPGDRYHPYRRDELIQMAYDRIHPDDEDDDECALTFRNKNEWKAYCKQRGPFIIDMT